MNTAPVIHIISLSLLIWSCNSHPQLNKTITEDTEKKIEKIQDKEIDDSLDTPLDLVVQWMEIAEDMRLGWYERTAENARADATLALAMFETANAIENEYSSYLKIENNNEGLPLNIAISATAAKTLTLLYKNQTDFIRNKRDLNIPNKILSEKESKAISLGESIAQKAFDRGKKMKKRNDIKYPATQAPHSSAPSGVYVPEYERSAIRNFDLSYLPWILTSQNQLRPPPPPKISEKRYAEAYEEVKVIGRKNSLKRTAEETEIAKFWFLIEMNPILREIATADGRSLTRNARMYAMFHMVTDDSWIAAADAKKYYQFWRPITAIPNAGEDGNAKTQKEKNWTPLLNTPPHPEYPCGHCVQAAAQQKILELELTNPNQIFKIKGVKTTNPRQITLKDYVSETLSSRLYAGAHFRFSNEVGEELGQKVATEVLEYWSNKKTD